MDIDFDFFDPKPIDFHGNKSLLKQVFAEDAETMDLSALSELIIAQPFLGSTVKVSEDGEDDPYALMTLLSLQQHKDLAAVKQLKQYLLGRIETAPQKESAEKFKSLLDSNIGWLINERLINMPPQIVPPLLTMLNEELGWVIDDASPRFLSYQSLIDSQKKPFDFEYVFMICKMYNEKESAVEDDEDDEPAEKRKKKAKVSLTEMFVQPEEEIFMTVSILVD